MIWRHSVPQFVKISRAEKCNRLDDPDLFHLEVPRIGVAVWNAVLRGGSGVEQNNHHVGVESLACGPRGDEQPES
jgi:hypothetical protein